MSMPISALLSFITIKAKGEFIIYPNELNFMKHCYALMQIRQGSIYWECILLPNEPKVEHFSILGPDQNIILLCIKLKHPPFLLVYMYKHVYTIIHVNLLTLSEEKVALHTINTQW